MSKLITTSGDVFEMNIDLVDVTSMHRPDTSWMLVDAKGHTHQWYADGQPATSYNPSAKYSVPSIVFVKDGEEYWDGDDEPHDVGHYECRECGEHICPAYTSDAHTVYAPGLKHCYINGVSVTNEEFQQRLNAAKG